TARPTTKSATPPLPSAAQPNRMALDAQKALLKDYCQGCHNENLKSGGMTLTSLDLAHPEQTPELAEKLIRKVRVGLMPPVNATKRPDRETAMLFVTTLESEMDRAAALHPNPGTRPFQRLTRDEYAHSIKDLLGIDVDVAQFLPAETLMARLDNS